MKPGQFMVIIAEHSNVRQTRILRLHNTIGVIYLKGQGVPQSESAAKIWLKRAAANNYHEAVEALKKLSGN